MTEDRQDPAASGRPGDGETVHPTGNASDQAIWNAFLDQIRSRGPNWRRYEMRGEIARGGMGVIHRVYDSDVRRPLAMKVILDQGDAEKTDDTPGVDSRSLGRFLEEAQVTGQLDHPGIVPVHELGVDQAGHVYFTMKLVKGEDLRSVFDRVHDPSDPGWNQTRALSVLLRVCEAMAYAHSKGVIHRDLKPGNVMVGKFGETYVMDWGLARVLGRDAPTDVRIRESPQAPSTAVKSHRKDSTDNSSDSPLITMDGDVVGTPAYMSPEQARGELDQIGPQSDIYALGALLYHLLAGHMPYVPPGVAANQHAIWRWVQREPPEPLRTVAQEAPAELVAICDKAMARSLTSRFANMEALAVDLRAFLETRVVRAYESGAIAELRKWVLRNRGVTATVVAAVVLIAILAGWFIVKLSAKEQEARASETRALAEMDRADRNAETAGRRAEEAETERKRVLQLSDIKRLSDLRAQTESLWPAYQDKVPALEAWLQRAQDLLNNLSTHEQTLSDLRSRGTPRPHPREHELADLKQQARALAAKVQDNAEAAEGSMEEQGEGALEKRIGSLSATIAREQPHSFADERDAWWHDTLIGLVSGLVKFAGDDRHGETIANIQQRLEFAKSIQDISVTDYQQEWNLAIASIADQSECPQYGGLELTEQIGLVPIGRDPESGLWEFWHVQTGVRPRRGQRDKLIPTTQTGLVFVLIPGGTFWMGAQATDPNGQNYDSGAESNESHEGHPVLVALDSFLLSKYELTQGQWTRIQGGNPSYHSPRQSRSVNKASLRNPVENVSWEDCVRLLRHLDLSLPTEAQWEYAARAGTNTPWWPGRDVLDLRGVANVGDQFMKASGGPQSLRHEDQLNDGYALHAPVGWYRANAFGLHDVVGNVWEWCLDGDADYGTPARPGDGLRAVHGGTDHAMRGGDYIFDAEAAGSARRVLLPPGAASPSTGVRPGRRLSR